LFGYTEQVATRTQEGKMGGAGARTGKYVSGGGRCDYRPATRGAGVCDEGVYDTKDIAILYEVVENNPHDERLCAYQTYGIFHMMTELLISRNAMRGEQYHAPCLLQRYFFSMQSFWHV
jgi:hypothetical protein